MNIRYDLDAQEVKNLVDLIDSKIDKIKKELDEKDHLPAIHDLMNAVIERDQKTMAYLKSKL